MSDELRMEMADCGSPERLLGVILRHHPDWKPPVPVEDFARSVGIEGFRDLEVDGFEAALMTDPEKTRGIILTRAGARPQRRMFTIGHELGHFLIPSHKGNRQCTAGDLRESRTDSLHRRQEAEANRFSAGLLMPKPWFLRDMEQLGDADVTHVQTLARKYGTSLEATINRYVELTDDACAFLFSKDEVIRYLRRSETFPWISVKNSDPLPPRCASRNAHALPLREPSGWTEIDGSIWFESRRGERVPTVLEQSIRQRDGYQITLLFVPSSDPDDDEEEELNESWAVRFRR